MLRLTTVLHAYWRSKVIFCDCFFLSFDHISHGLLSLIYLLEILYFIDIESPYLHYLPLDLYFIWGILFVLWNKCVFFFIAYTLLAHLKKLSLLPKQIHCFVMSSWPVYGHNVILHLFRLYIVSFFLLKIRLLYS